MYYPGDKQTIVLRTADSVSSELKEWPPLLAKIFATRGIALASELDRSLASLPSPWAIVGMEGMVTALIDALRQSVCICIVADFDADGATSCAVALRGLTLLGAKHVKFIVPNRFEFGYGLTPEIVELVAQLNAHLIITVDNGISSIDGVAAAQAKGIRVLITDHHLPGASLPKATAIVNPNTPGNEAQFKDLAGVGVIFYVLMALRSRLREQGWFAEQGLQEPNLAQLLDFVALGTVADVVPLSRVNRILVHQGLLRIRAGAAHEGIKALLQVSGKTASTLAAADLGFALGPRLNAAGRMDDMSLGIQCLITNDAGLAHSIALQLDDLNNDRKDIETQMKRQALALLNEMRLADSKHLSSGICLYDENWHQGVIGILAGRIKDRLHRPVIAFAPAGKDTIKGSARSIPGLHIRDVLSDIAATQPKLLTKFGGHAMAAGLTIAMHDLPAFTLMFDEMVNRRLTQLDLEQKVWSDGVLSEYEMTLATADLIQNAATWGQTFPEPVFHGQFEVVQARIVGQKHLKLVLRLNNSSLLIDGIAFFVEQVEHWQGVRSVLAAYKLAVNDYQGKRSVQFIIQYLEKLA